jgi:uncharacterized membrane protein
VLSFIFYSAFLTFIVFRCYAEAKQLRNRYSLSYMTLSIEFIFIVEFFLGEFITSFGLALTD